MKMLEQSLTQARAGWRRAKARTAQASPGRVTPERLVLRLDPDGPGAPPVGVADGCAPPEPLNLLQWRDLLLDVMAWLGPLPVTVLAYHRGDHPLLADLVRFAHRLECPTELVSDGTGLHGDRVDELLDCGLDRVRFLVGGVSDEVHRAVVGNPLVEATGAVLDWIQRGRERRAPVDIEVALPWVGPAATEVRAVMGWARQAGVDGFRIVAPWRAMDLPADPELLDDIAADNLGFNRTPMATIGELHAMVASQDGEPGILRRARGFRRRLHNCPVGGLRLEVVENGTVCCCPFKEPLMLGDSITEAWMGAADHLRAIRNCSRSCVHLELAPRPILG